VRRPDRPSHSWEIGVSDGARTRGHKGHNLVLYQLSYAHRMKLNSILAMKHSKQKVIISYLKILNFSI
jgi:hypothetical protein